MSRSSCMISNLEAGSEHIADCAYTSTLCWRHMNAPPRFGRFSLEQMIRSEVGKKLSLIFWFIFLWGGGEIWAGPLFGSRWERPIPKRRYEGAFLLAFFFSFLLARTVSALNLVFAFFFSFRSPPYSALLLLDLCAPPDWEGGYNLAHFIFRIYSFLPFFFLLVWFIIFGV